MISFYYETDFSLRKEFEISNWISGVIASENRKEGEINYIFCDDSYLHKLNVKFLDHDTLTDIISFDNSLGKILHGDVFISVERAQDNAKDFDVSFDEEIHRLIVHGVLHYCGFNDKTAEDAKIMRDKEDFYLKQLSVNS